MNPGSETSKYILQIIFLFLIREIVALFQIDVDNDNDDDESNGKALQ